MLRGPARANARSPRTVAYVSGMRKQSRAPRPSFTHLIAQLGGVPAKNSPRDGERFEALAAIMSSIWAPLYWHDFKKR